MLVLLYKTDFDLLVLTKWKEKVWIWDKKMSQQVYLHGISVQLKREFHNLLHVWAMAMKFEC